MKVGVCTPFPDVIVHLNQATTNSAERRGEKEYNSVTNTIAAIDYKEKESQDDQMDRHKEFVTIDDNELDKDW